MDLFDEILIRKYLNLSRIIKENQAYREEIRRVFYTKNMNTRMTYEEVQTDIHEMITLGFRPDIEIEKLLTRQDSITQLIIRHTFRERHFSKFLTSLTPFERSCLKERYKYNRDVFCPPTLLEKTLDEINEIETAICFRERREPDVFENEKPLDHNESLERMCDFFEL